MKRKREWILLAVYAALLIVLALNHEMWRDEVRAFTVAANSPSWSAMFGSLNHEGHPAVWYALLRAGFAVTHSNWVLPATALGVAILTAWLILWYAPFPLWLRALTIFGAFLGYELSVVARNYGVGVLCMVLACMAFENRAKRPVLLAIPLALLANTSVHGAIAAAVLLGFWALDLADGTLRRNVLSPLTILSATGVVLAIGLGLWSARPAPDIGFGTQIDLLNLSRFLKSVLIDPGKGLLGFRDANIAAAGELPWRLTPISGAVASRIIVDASLAWLAFHSRRSWKALLSMAVAILVFEVLFRAIYTGGLRHEGILLFAIFSICWMDISRQPRELRPVVTRRFALGLSPLFAFQSLALLVLIHRAIRYEESGSKGYGSFLNANPRYNNAILASEPDYFMESMPFYVKNRIYMPRQREFSRAVYFDQGKRRQKDLTLSQLTAISDSVACAEKSILLLAIGKPQPTGRPGEGYVAYHALFHWPPEETRPVVPESPMVADFPRATSDEVYQVYEIDPVKACARRRGVM